MSRHAWAVLPGSAMRQESPGSSGSRGPSRLDLITSSAHRQERCASQKPPQAHRRVSAGVRAERARAAHPLGRPLHGHSHKPVPACCLCQFASRQNSWLS